MGRVCAICEKRAVYQVSVDTGRFLHNFFYCENHKPQKVKITKVNEGLKTVKWDD